MDSGRKTNSCGPTLLDDVVSMIFTKIRYLLDSESTRLTMKTTTLPQAMYDANSTWENSSKWEIFLPPTQNGNEKLTRSQIYVRKELMQQLSLFLPPFCIVVHMTWKRWHYHVVVSTPWRWRQIDVLELNKAITYPRSWLAGCCGLLLQKQYENGDDFIFCLLPLLSLCVGNFPVVCGVQADR